MTGNDKLIVALDYPSLEQAEQTIKTLSSSVSIYKIGKELFTAAGPDAIRMVHSYKAKVFLDLKFHDIPNTVASACKSACEQGVFMINVHASGGGAMMKEAALALQRSVSKGSRPILLGVTVLTSMKEEDLKEIGVQASVTAQVERLALLAKASGLDGVVASAQEAALIRKVAGKEFVIVTPGVRPEWAAAQDQKRITTPSEAIRNGANFIVVGRPITQHQDPKAAAEKISQEIMSVV